MASFAPAQSEIRSKWGDLVDDAVILKMPGEVQNGVKTVVGWLKQASLEVREAGRRTLATLQSSSDIGNFQKSSKRPDSLIIIHYNDVYNIESTNSELGGATRFCTAVKEILKTTTPPPLVLFSGDAISPSTISLFTKGEHIVPVLNEVGTHCAVFGNHEFDFGLEILSERVKCTDFPWLMSNVIDNETGRPLGDGKITHVIDWEGYRIGLVGLVEREWLDTLPTINPDEVTFIDFIEAGSKLGGQLKQEGCDYVIALTHMRFPNDRKLAEECENIDLILGGHDHVFHFEEINNKFIIKSGTDFRNFSKITVDLTGKEKVNIEKIDVTQQFEEDEVLLKQLQKYTAMMDGKMKEVLGEFTVELDGRFESIRTSETNLGNWVCDVVLAATGADLVIINSGTLRTDRIHPPGQFTLADLVNMIPMRDPIVVLEVSGKVIHQALENGVSQWPKLEGRFPQVAGVQFGFYPDKPPGKRVPPELIRIGDEYLVMDNLYRLATKTYVASGCDGYVVMKTAKVLLNEESCPELGLAIQNHFEAIKVRTGRSKRTSRHRQSLVTLSRRHSLVKQLDGIDCDGPPPLRRLNTLQPKSDDFCPTGVNLHQSVLSRKASIDDLEQESCLLAPKIERRIVRLNNELYTDMLMTKEKNLASSVIEEVDETADITSA